MATTTYGINDPLAVKLWAKRLSVEALKATMLYRFIGNTADSMIMRREELSKGAGDTLTYGLRMQLNANGALGDGILEGNEEAMITYTDSLVINQLRNAVRITGRMSQERVPFEIRDEASAALVDWWADRFDWSGFNQLCGNVGPSASANGSLTGVDTRWTGNNAPIATDAAHYTNAAAGADDSTLSSGNVFTLSMIDKAVERAQVATPAIRQVNVNGKRMFVAILHPYQVTDMRTSTSTGQWLDIQKAAMTGGQVSDNPIFDGSLGVYNNVILHSDYRVTPGFNPNASNAGIPTVRRAIFCGAQAAMCGFGQDNNDDRFTWSEQFFDYANQLGVSAGCIYGLKKTTYNGADFGVIVMSSYAAAH